MYSQERLVHMFTRQHGHEYSKQHCSSKQNPNFYKEEKSWMNYDLVKKQNAIYLHMNMIESRVYIVEQQKASFRKIHTIWFYLPKFPKQAKWNNILFRNTLKWTGMGEFNSDNHYIYYCRQESLRRNGVAIMVNKRVRNAVLGCNLWLTEWSLFVSKANHLISQ